MENKKPSTTPLDAGAALCAAEPSFRILYYGATGAAVPFKWESQPGTPKHALSDGASLPPLTPPPSYYTAGGSSSPTKPKKKKRTTLPRLVRWNSGHVSPGGSYSSSSTSSSSYGGDSSLYYSPSPPSRKQRVRSVLMCFGLTALVNDGCGYPVSSMKNALLSAVACRRSSHTVDYIV